MRKTRFMAVLLAVVMLLGTMPAALAANSANTGDVYFEDNGVRLAKPASALDGNWETKINLIVESITDQTPVAVEFVLDGTSSLYSDGQQMTIASVAEQARQILYNKNAYMGITVFGRDVVREDPDDITTMPMQKVPASSSGLGVLDSSWVINQLMNNPDMLGTNIQAGIKAGLDDLATAPSGTIKYLVLITDGGSYWWNENNTPVNNNIDGQSLQNSDAADGGYASFASLENLLKVPASQMAAKDYADECEALPDAVKKIREDHGDAANENDRSGEYTNFEKGVYHAAKAVDAVKNAGVNLVVISRPYYAGQGNENVAALSRLAGEFITYASDPSRCVASRDLSDSNIKEIVETIAGTATTVVRKGSTITDLLGDSKYDAAAGHTGADASYNYNLVDSKGFTLNIGGQDVPVTGRSGNTWTFNDGSKLVWTGLGDKEYFELTLGKDLKIGEKLVLSYTAVLNERDTNVGDHVTYPNVQAYLHLLNTPETENLMFPEPVLQYHVGSGGGGGTEITPEPVPGGDKPELNTTDHYAYIIGRKDGLVHPEAQITRAEVATIFFRMLTDESRNELWSQSNPYSDITPDMWCNAAVSTMTRAGVIEGFKDGTFRPYAPITRAQFATIAVRFFEVTYAGEDKFSDIADHWAADYINKAAEAAIIAGFQDGTFRPNTYITRAQAMTIFNRVLGRAPEKDHLLNGMITWPDNMDTSAWYYATMQEATNSHEYEKVTADDGTVYEVWTKLLPVRDWAAFEKEWSDSNSAANPGEVISAVVLDR